MNSVRGRFLSVSRFQEQSLRLEVPEPPHTSVYLSETVHTGKERVKYMSHNAEDGVWQFLGDSMAKGDGPVVSCFHHSIDNRQRPELERTRRSAGGWYAERSKTGSHGSGVSRNPMNQKLLTKQL